MCWDLGFKTMFASTRLVIELQYSMYVACGRKPLQTAQGGKHELLHLSIPPAQLSGKSPQKPFTWTAIQLSRVNNNYVINMIWGSYTRHRFCS